MLRTRIVILVAAFFFCVRVNAVDAAVQGFTSATNFVANISRSAIPPTIEEDIYTTPFLSVDTGAWAWASMEWGLAITASIDIGLLDLIDQEAPLYFDSSWNLNLNQFKAWLATIIRAESGYGSYGAHSQYGGGYTGDAFDHIVVGSDFRFSSGIGPYQLDRYSSEAWHLWKTEDKIDPQMATESAARWHYDNRGSGSTLSDFANGSPWNGVKPPDTGDYWRVVTGTNWEDHSSGSAYLDWASIKSQLAANAASRPYMSYTNNIVDVGSLMWNIQASENLLTDSGRSIIFCDMYPTLLITARRWGGTEVCDYYYTYRTDGGHPIEVWAWDNYWNTGNEYKYIFARECNGPFPEARSGSSAGYPALSVPALDFPPSVDTFNVHPTTVTLGHSFTISYTVSDDISLQQAALWRADDVGGTPDWGSTANPIQTAPLAGPTNYSGSFQDTPAAAGSYWYGLHTVDTSGQWRIEPNPPGPILVTVIPSNDPQLHNSLVSPGSGDTNTEFYWYIDYYDEDTDPPSAKEVHIDDAVYEMSLYSGTAANGTYRYGPMTLGMGIHSYYFYFTDGNGGSDRLPESGLYSGPSVVDLNTPGDINGDGKIDLADFATLSSQWLQSPGFPSADIFPREGDGTVNLLDLNVIIQHWLESTDP